MQVWRRDIAAGRFFFHDVSIALRRAQVVMAQQALDGRHRHGDFGPRLGADALEFPHMADVVHGRGAVGKAAAQGLFKPLQSRGVVHQGT